MKKTSFCIFILLITLNINGQHYRKNVRPVKNVILMIPDGTSIGVVSATRWYKVYNKLGENLAIDPYICGTVKTHSSNAPIGDSAPTTACYMTGVLQQTGNISIYPSDDPENDLYSMDPALAFQPLATILEAAKIEQNKAVGLVVTCEFAHATPADCAAHYYKRSVYEYIAPQIVYNNLDVVFSGGTSLLTDDIREHFNNTGTVLIEDDLQKFRTFNGMEKVWALFCERGFPYDLDRDTTKIPSLVEMTKKALSCLSQNKDGFFLMVEGSAVDWAAHANDAVGCITEFLAFDRAVEAALEFAKKDGQTAVIVLPDHGNSGFTIGRTGLKSYDKATLSELFAGVSGYKKTAAGLEKILLQHKPEEFKTVFRQHTNIDLTEKELNLLLSSKNYKAANYMEISNSVNMGSSISQIMNSRVYFGFTSGGHTGEEVFLSVYHPQGDIPVGMNTNIEINRYLFDVVGLKTPLWDMTKRIYAKHTDVFAGLNYTIDKSNDFPVLIVKNGKNTLEVPAFKSVVSLNGNLINLESVTVYIDKNDTFYLPSELSNKL